MENSPFLIIILSLLACQCPSYIARDLGKFWHITDIHYDNSYSDEAVSCYKDVPISQRNQFGNQWCDSPWALVEGAIHAMKMIAHDVDFIIWTGDNIFHARKPDEVLNETIVLNLIENITTSISNLFPGTPTYPTLGNHDYYPKSQLPGEVNNIYEKVGELWAPLINSTMDSIFNTGGYYTLLLREGLRLMALNTNLYYYSNRATKDQNDPGNQFQWMEDVLNQAKMDREKVMVIGHVPPGVKTMEWNDITWFREGFSTKFNDIIHRHRDTIEVMYFGHEHKDTLKIYEFEGAATIPVFLAPSVTPWRYIKTVDVAETPFHNPGIRLVTYDRSDGYPVEISQYYLDLNKTTFTPKSDVTWELLYNFTAAYDMSDLSGTSLMSSWINKEELFQEYFAHIFVNAEPLLDCDKSCRASIICSIRHIEQVGFDTCKTNLVNSVKDGTTTTSTVSDSATQMIRSEVLPILIYVFSRFL